MLYPQALTWDQPNINYTLNLNHWVPVFQQAYCSYVKTIQDFYLWKITFLHLGQSPSHRRWRGRDNGWEWQPSLSSNNLHISPWMTNQPLSHAWIARNFENCLLGLDDGPKRWVTIQTKEKQDLPLFILCTILPQITPPPPPLRQCTTTGDETLKPNDTQWKCQSNWGCIYRDLLWYCKNIHTI